MEPTIFAPRLKFFKFGLWFDVFYCLVNYRVVAAGNGTFRIITHLLRQISWILEILRTSLRRAPDPLNPWSSWWAFSQLHQGISSFFSNLSEILHMGIICVYFKKNLNNFFLKSPPISHVFKYFLRKSMIQRQARFTHISPQVKIRGLGACGLFNT